MDEEVTNATLQSILFHIRPILEEKICSGTNHTDGDDALEHTEDEWKVWVWSLGTVTCINISSLLIVFLLPNKNKKYYPYVMTLIVSLGISVLLCDAVFHLLPHALGLHGNEDEHEENLE